MSIYRIAISSESNYGESTVLNVETLPELKLATAELIDIVLGFGGAGTTISIKKCAVTADADEKEVTEDADDS